MQLDQVKRKIPSVLFSWDTYSTSREGWSEPLVVFLDLRSENLSVSVLDKLQFLVLFCVIMHIQLISINLKAVLYLSEGFSFPFLSHSGSALYFNLLFASLQ